MTISDTLERFIKSLCAGLRRPGTVGRYYNTPQRSAMTCDLDRIVAEDRLGVCYFGTNWDARQRPLFRRLAAEPWMNVFGPAKSWSFLKGQSYRGQLPFDGEAVQHAYAEAGVGLVTLSQGHALDDVISNRIFEISSVGAVAICPDIPWIKEASPTTFSTIRHSDQPAQSPRGSTRRWR